MKNTIGIKEFPMHMQGFATDLEKGVMYFSCTNILIKTDLDGNELKRAEVFGGHLGDICFCEGKIYGTLLGTPKHGDPWNAWTSYIVDIFDEELNLLEQKEVGYMTETVAGENPYGLNAIDGITVAHGHLFIACSIETGEQYVNQVVLEHTLDVEFVKLHAFEVGNTPFGIQNLSYDAEQDCMWITVYGPAKPYQAKEVLYKVNIDLSAYTEKYKISTPYGFQPLGDGLYYLSEHQGKYPHCDGYAHLYRYDGNGFERV